jgi:uncharacterized membrane protein
LRPPRSALLTVAKVFLVDMSGLTGIYRCCLHRLGLVLVGIGWLYQRLLFPPPAAAPMSRRIAVNRSTRSTTAGTGC